MTNQPLTEKEEEERITPMPTTTMPPCHKSYRECREIRALIPDETSHHIRDTSRIQTRMLGDADRRETSLSTKSLEHLFSPPMKEAQPEVHESKSVASRSLLDL